MLPAVCQGRLRYKGKSRISKEEPVMSSRESAKREKAVIKAIRVRKVLCLVLAAFCLYFVYNIISIRVNLKREQQALEILDKQLFEQRLLNEELERIVYSDGENDYVERIAREKLGYAAIDERIFVDISG